MRCLVPLFILICITIAQISPAAGTTPIASSGAEDLGNNRYKLGEIIIDKNTNSIKFPAKVNMQEGLIELFLCAPYGKTHESLLVTDVNGINLNLALILIGCKEGDIKVKEQGQDVIPQGTLVTIEIEFKDDDEKVKRVRAEDWIYNDKLKAAMPHTNWVYTGSFIHEGEYMAKATGTYIVTFHDPYTIIDLPLKEGADDTVYWVNKDAAKKKAHPVTVIITRVKEDDENKKEDDSNDAKTEEGAGDGQTKSDDRSGDIVVDLTADGSVLVQGEEHDLDSLVDVIGAIVEEKGPDNVHVILGADKTLRYQKVIDAIAVIRDAGCSNVSFAAQRKDHENGSATDDGPAEPDKDRMSLLVNVRENGEITISGKKYDIDAMKTLITDLKKKTGKDGFPVYLRADKDLEYGRVEEIIKAIEGNRLPRHLLRRNAGKRGPLLGSHSQRP